jgi:hypothetical protein
MSFPFFSILFLLAHIAAAFSNYSPIENFE